MVQSDELNYIRIPYPDSGDLQLKIVVPMCTLVISPGIGNVWVTGRYSDPKVVAPLNITQSENTAHIVAVGAFAYRTPRKYLPNMQLSFGRVHPFALSISAGDLANRLDFGGIPITSLEFQYGAGSQSIDFSYPGPRLLERLKIRADTGPVRITNLANASPAEMQLTGDSTSYRLDYGGALKQSANIHFGPAVSSAEILIPAGTAIKVKSGSAPRSSLKDDFIHSENAYANLPAREHREPLLSIQYSAGFNPLRVKYI